MAHKLSERLADEAAEEFGREGLHHLGQAVSAAVEAHDEGRFLAAIAKHNLSSAAVCKLALAGVCLVSERILKADAELN